MTSFTIIRDVSISLREVLKTIEFPDDNFKFQNDSIVFDSPGEVIASATPKISIFLYQTTETSLSRTLDRPILGTDKTHQPPLIIDLCYLITPYAQNRETEMIILERIMQTLYENAVLKGDKLQGSLRAIKNYLFSVHNITSENPKKQRNRKIYQDLENNVVNQDLQEMLEYHCAHFSKNPQVSKETDSVWNIVDSENQRQYIVRKQHNRLDIWGQNTEIRITPLHLSLNELHTLWGIFPSKPFKLSTAFLVTPVVIAPLQNLDMEIFYPGEIRVQDNFVTDKKRK